MKEKGKSNQTMRTFFSCTILLAMAAQCNAFNLFSYYFGDYKIHIRNGFSGNNMLKLQCSSMDDDLGEKSVWNGESFHTSILAITLWECHISRSNVPQMVRFSESVIGMLGKMEYICKTFL